MAPPPPSDRRNSRVGIGSAGKPSVPLNAKKAAASSKDTTPKRKDGTPRATSARTAEAKKTKPPTLKKTPSPPSKVKEPESGPLTRMQIQKRIESCDEPHLFKLGDSGVTLRYAYVAQRGYYPESPDKANQDAFKIIEGFDGNSDQIYFGVFDGHGGDGDKCSGFVRDNVDEELKRQISLHPGNFTAAYTETYLALNQMMHYTDFDDLLAGTTACTAFFHGTQITLANIGDSRAILGEKTSEKVIGISLTSDQTPYRQDERERCKKMGAVVMSQDQIEGLEPLHEDWGLNLGEEVDEDGDPPRLWASKGGGVPEPYPGCAFTRSIGDAVGECVGVVANAEISKREVKKTDEFMCLASDGVWEFMTNQTVVDMIVSFNDPLDACHAVVAESYRLWLQYDVRTDDITMILIMFDKEEESFKAKESQNLRIRTSFSIEEGEAWEGDDLSSFSKVKESTRHKPTRRGISKEKKARLKESMAIAASQESEDGDLTDWQLKVVPKSEEETARLRSALHLSFLFRHLSESQIEQLYGAMEKISVKKGEVVIKQGDQGSTFYVVDNGEFSVTVDDVEILQYSTGGGKHPFFGELSLMYSQPRAASVTAMTSGLLWALDRKSFRSILMKSQSASPQKMLWSVQLLKPLSVSQLQKVQDLLTKKTCKSGAAIVGESNPCDGLYIISDGRVTVTRNAGNGDVSKDLGPGQCFGEDELTSAKHANDVVKAVATSSTVTFLYVSRQTFEQALGPLQKIIDAAEQRREDTLAHKTKQEKAEGLYHVSLGDFIIEATTCSRDPFNYMLATHDDKKYTIRSVSKTKAAEMGLVDRIEAEKALLSDIEFDHPLLPEQLGAFEDEDCMYSVFRSRVSIVLASLIEEQGITEREATFYVASITLALEYLHSEQIHILHRSLSPQAIVLDEHGYVQLMDLRYAVKAAPMPVDFCGDAHYFSPEQISGTGHSYPTDYWALGQLLYEMITGGESPFLTGKQGEDTVVSIYKRITDMAPQKADAIKFPEGCDPSPPVRELLAGLMQPNPAKRMGAKELRKTAWLSSFSWKKLETRELEAPHQKQAADAIAAHADPLAAAKFAEPIW